MATSNRQNNVPADLQPYYDEPRKPTNSVARWITRVLAIIIFVVLCVIFVRWVWHQTHETTDDTAPATSQQAGKPGKTTAPAKTSTNQGLITTNDGDDSASTTSSATESGTQTAGNAASASVQSSTNASTQLTNTGPGQTLTVFIAASFCFALLYHLRLRNIQ